MKSNYAYFSRKYRSFFQHEYFIFQDLIPDMNLFYAQYASIQPWLQKKTKINLGEKQLYQTPNERDKLVNFFISLSINFSMSLNVDHFKQFVGWALRMYSLCLLQYQLPFILVEC